MKKPARRVCPLCERVLNNTHTESLRDMADFHKQAHWKILRIPAVKEIWDGFYDSLPKKIGGTTDQL